MRPLFRTTRRACLAGLGAAFVTPAAGRDAIGGAEALAGARFKLEGREYVLDDVIAPDESFPPGSAPAPYAGAARSALEAALDRGRPVIETARTDRWGRILCRAAMAGKEESLQAHLVREGALRVRPRSSNHGFIAGLLKIEAAAREAGRGLWRLDAYRVLNANRGEGAPAGAFVIYVGTVKKAAAYKGRLYINFGADYREDVTATARTRAFRRWRTNAFDPEKAAGRLARFRGALAWINGPSIELDHEMQIDLL